MNMLNENLLSAGSTATSINSNYAVISRMNYASAQCITAGTGVGSVQFQVSNDAPGTTPSNWSLIGSSVAVTAASTVLIPATLVAYSYIRVAYVSTSGTGTITINLIANTP